jgi:ribokinase
MVRIVVVGSANVDFVVQTPHIPQPGETVLGRNFVMAMGGKGANQAVGAVRLGAEVIFVARLGQDVFGDQCLSAYQREGIVTPSHVENAARVFEAADALVLQLEVPVETDIAAARLARERGVRVILNPAPARALPAELLGLVDVITPNRIELAQLARKSESEVQAMSDEPLAHLALGLDVSGAVITLGAQGALAVGSWGRARVSPFAVSPVDTTAAGDAFNAGLAVALGTGQKNLPDAAQYANACGALATTKFGAQPSLPRAAEVEALLTRHKA